MYAATAYIVLEASTIVFPRLGLADWTVTFLMVFLIVGFPVALTLSWIFDVSHEGLQKTENIDELDEKVVEKKKRKLKVSDLVIAILVVVVCFLIYPKLFQKDRLKEIRDDKGKISVAIMPFENLTGDSLYNTWQGGMQNLLISELSNSPELQVRQYLTMSTILGQKKNASQASLSPGHARELALNLETSTYVQGKIMKAGEQIRINAQLINSESEEIYRTYQVDGSSESDLFFLSDSLGNLIRNFLEIQQLVGGFNSPQVSPLANTQSAEALRYYISSYESFEELDVESTVRWLLMAIETDPNFIDAYIFLSLTYASMLESKQSEYWCDRGYERREQTTLRGQLFLDHLHAYHYETPYEEIRYCRQLLDIDEMNTTYWLMMGDAYNKLDQYEEAIVCFEKVLEIHDKWGTQIRIPHLYYWMSEALHDFGNHKREREVYELGVKGFPNDALIVKYQATCALSQGETDQAESCLKQFRSMREAEGWEEARILSGMASAYYYADKMNHAEKYFRQGYDLNPENPYRMNGLARVLIQNDTNLAEGMELAEKAVKLEPDYYGILHTYGLGLYKQGHFKKALEVLNKAWEVRGPYDLDLKREIEAVEKALTQNEQVQN